MKTNLIKALLAVAVAPLFFATHAMGALIIWDTPVDVDTTHDSQVSNVGTLLAAYAGTGFASSGGLSVNGVNFLNSTPYITLAPSGGAAHGGTGSGNYNNLLTTGNYITNGTSSTTPSVLSGLTFGQTYLIQIWTPFWDVNYSTAFASVAPSGATNSLDSNPAKNQSLALNLGVDAIPPQYILGTFTADGTPDIHGHVTQNLFTAGSNTFGIISAIQIREVPEPTTVALLGIGVLSLVVRRRFRQRELVA